MPASVKMMLINQPYKILKSKKRKSILSQPGEEKNITIAMTELKEIPDFDPVFLSAKNPHPLDMTIKFMEDSHTYYVKFHTGNFSCEHVLSTSGFVGNYFSHFDPETIVKKMGNHTRIRKYKGMTNDQIKTVWRENGEQASKIGTNFHFLLESFYNGMDLKPYDKYGVVQQFRRWHEKHVVPQKLIPFRSEQRMRTDLNTRLTGTADMLFALPVQDHTSGVLKLVMRDWKFSKEIKFSSSFPGTYGCCSHLDNCNFNKYLLQQNVYKYILEKFYTNWKYQGHIYKRVEVVDMALAVFHDSQEDFQHIELMFVQPLIEEMFLEREQQLKYLLVGDEKKAESVIMGVTSSFITTPTEQRDDPQVLIDEDDDDDILEPLTV
jgi:hypothetical protein